MNLQQFLLALRARFGVFFMVFAATVLAAAAVSLLLPKSYKATASLLVNPNKDEQSLSNVLHPLVLPQERLSYMQTQMDIITSEKVARKVVQELKLETSRSDVIQVSFSSTDPRLSALVANAFAKAYIDTMLELRVEPTREAAAWFEEQLKGLRANLEDTQARLTDYQRKQGIISADERYDVENARLGELSSQLVKAQEQAFDLETRERQARDFLKRGASPDKLPDVLSNAYIQKLKADLVRGEAKLQELSTEYGVNHPQYQRQVSENRSLREKLEVEMKAVVAGMENSKQQSRQREAELRRALAAQRERLLEIKGDRNELTVLTRNAETAQRTYEAAMQRSVISKVESRASQGTVALLDPAVAPRRPSHPKIFLNIILAVLVGTMLGVGIVMLMEMFDRRVRSLRDLDLEVPLLAVLNTWQPARDRRLGGAEGGRRALPNPA